MTGKVMLGILLTLGLSLTLPAQNARNQGVASSARTDVSAVAGPFLQEYCITCHNQTKRSGALALDSLNPKNVGENPAAWENVLRRVRARREPLVGPGKPDEATYQSVISKLELALDQAYPATAQATAARATDAELGTRIATLIWGGAPDAELIQAAQQGQLRDPAGLEKQVQRMLRDPKSSHLVTDFFEQWLSVDNLGKAKPDPSRYPEADPELLQSMASETRLFLESQLREDRGALELLTANYTFLNERLARHYGIPNISGTGFRRVSWPNNNRAGLLGQGSVLTVTSTSGRTSPILRGKWILATILGTPTPPPAPNVRPLGDSEADRARPMRERLVAHQINPACTSCHRIFDPLGLALENFDGIGQWRNTDGANPIDASGAFIDGTSFNGPAELRAGLAKYKDAYYSNITQQLLGYALGRKARTWRVNDYEMPSVRAIVRAAAANDYRWSSIVLGIVQSAPFQAQNVMP